MFVPERQKGLVEPRLMTAAQAANYLGRKTTHVLKSLPFAPVPIGKGQLWDRNAIDRYLDVLSGIVTGPMNDDEAEVIDEIARHFR